MILTSITSGKETTQGELLGTPFPITVILIINYNINTQITEGTIVYFVMLRS